MFNLCGFYLLFVGCFLLAVTPLPNDEPNYELTPNFFEGDMILSPEQVQWLGLTPSDRKRRNAILNPNALWPNGIFYYQISREFTRTEVTRINQAMKHISDNTCIRFVRRTTQRNYAIVRPDTSGCSAQIGYRNRGIQYVNLKQMGRNSTGCFTMGTIVHEFLHSLGLYHQHSATNRDSYVRINQGNIMPDKVSNFRKNSPTVSGSYGVPYDYGSIMHYGTHFFSANGQATIVPLRRNVTIGQRVRLSAGDIQKLRRMYRCRRA